MCTWPDNTGVKNTPGTLIYDVITMERVSVYIALPCSFAIHHAMVAIIASSECTGLEVLKVLSG